MYYKSSESRNWVGAVTVIQSWLLSLWTDISCLRRNCPDEFYRDAVFLSAILHILTCFNRTLDQKLPSGSMYVQLNSSTFAPVHYHSSLPASASLLAYCSIFDVVSTSWRTSCSTNSGAASDQSPKMTSGGSLTEVLIRVVYIIVNTISLTERIWFLRQFALDRCSFLVVVLSALLLISAGFQ